MASFAGGEIEAFVSDPTSGVNSVSWEFARSPVTGRVGPTQPLADALDKANISWKIQG